MYYSGSSYCGLPKLAWAQALMHAVSNCINTWKQHPPVPLCCHVSQQPAALPVLLLHGSKLRLQQHNLQHDTLKGVGKQLLLISQAQKQQLCLQALGDMQPAATAVYPTTPSPD